MASRLHIDLLLPQDFELDRRLRNTACKQHAPDTRNKKKIGVRNNQEPSVWWSAHSSIKCAILDVAAGFGRLPLLRVQLRGVRRAFQDGCGADVFLLPLLLVDVGCHCHDEPKSLFPGSHGSGGHFAA